MKRVRISGRLQAGVAGTAVLSVLGAGFAVVQLALGTATMTSAVSQFASRQTEVEQMERELASLQTDLGQIKTTTKSYIAKLEARHALLAAAYEGRAVSGDLAAAVTPVGGAESRAAAEMAALFGAVEAGQGDLAAKARQKLDAKYSASVQAVSRLGVHPSLIGGGVLAVGGPYEPVAAGSVAASSGVVTAATAGPAPATKADPQFKALFNSWRRLDQLQQGMASIPSSRPVQNLILTSGYGVRSDPFRGGAAMHAGVDIPGPIGTPIYATADGIVSRSGWVGGYGNLVELGHGRGIQTRYGHLSAILVTAGTRIKRGQMIGMMGSTGRSTGSHLHYEVRLEGSAINPMPFLKASDSLLALQASKASAVTAQGGPSAQK